MDQAKKLVIISKLDQFAVDNIGNIYTINESQITKYLPSGKLFMRYSNLQLGNITFMDVTNPLKILLYYRDLQQIVFLDDQLSVNSNQVALTNLGYEQTELVCAGANNSFWIYDKQNNEILRFNQYSKIICATGNLKQILKTNLSPAYMFEFNGFLYLNCPDNGIYVFDMYGAFSKVIAIKKLKEFQVEENILYYQKDSLFCSYNFKYIDEVCKPITSAHNLLNVRFFKNQLYKAYKDSVVVEAI